MTNYLFEIILVCALRFVKISGLPLIVSSLASQVVRLQKWELMDGDVAVNMNKGLCVMFGKKFQVE